MGTIVCILALLLAGHGLGLIIKMRMFCLLIKRVETKYIKKIDGIVVDVDTYVKDGKLLMRPSVEFTLEGEGEKCCRSINPNIIVEDITQFSYYPKDFHIGDKVTVWYNLDNDAMFVEQKMQLTRLFVRLFIPGCFFIISSILQSFPKSFPIQCATSVTCPGAFRLAEVVSSMSEGRILSWNVLSYQEKYATTALFPLA